MTGYGPTNSLWYFVENKTFRHAVVIVKWLLVRPFSVFAVSLYVIRAWLLYFDMRVSQLTKNLEWRMAINPTIASNNWYLNPINQRRFGSNGIYLVLLAIISAIAEIGICGLLMYVGYSKYDWLLPSIVLVMLQFVKV